MQSINFIGKSLITRGNLVGFECFAISSSYLQPRRWKRKPSWLPTAKTKLFRIHQRPVIPEEDNDELKRLHDNYKTAMKSINKFLQEEYARNQVKTDEASIKKAEDEDFARCLAINDSWNKEVAKQRDARVQEERKVEEEQILLELDAREKEHGDVMRRIDEKIRKLKLDSETFITPENIDEAIEKAMLSVVNYNKCIDIYGNYYSGSAEEVAAEIVESRVKYFEMREADRLKANT